MGKISKVAGATDRDTGLGFAGDPDDEAGAYGTHVTGDSEAPPEDLEKMADEEREALATAQETDDPEQGDETSGPALVGQEHEEGGEQYDPADHTVSEVNEYLSTADDREARRVVAAERAGKNRSGVRAE